MLGHVVNHQTFKITLEYRKDWVVWLDYENLHLMQCLERFLQCEVESFSWGERFQEFLFQRYYIMYMCYFIYYYSRYYSCNCIHISLFTIGNTTKLDKVNLRLRTVPWKLHFSSREYNWRRKTKINQKKMNENGSLWIAGSGIFRDADGRNERLCLD